MELYLAAEGFERELELELELGTALRGSFERHGERLFMIKDPASLPLEGTTQGSLPTPSWAQCQFREVTVHSFDSISEAADILKSNHGLRWHSLSATHHRRAALIQEKVPPLKLKPWPFQPAAATPTLPPWATWGLLDRNRLFIAHNCFPAVPAGIYDFAERKKGPPSRAYLKLWEALTRFGLLISKQDEVLELGASPGGWTWVLAQLGCAVQAVDRAELDPPLMKNRRIKFVKGDAFKVLPSASTRWLMSDLICTPAKLLNYLHQALEVNPALGLVCTLKFKGETDFEVSRRFLAEIPGAQLAHLWHNKHELTCVREPLN